ncbi:P4b major core protein precursor [Equine molluscum contagiosum-like virus]|nr:P4b major core protein precursor [Equine molluscum contagiosum-like virus]
MATDSASTQCQAPLFLQARVNLGAQYCNQLLALVERSHVHEATPSTVCSVCQALSQVLPEDAVSAGARQQRPVRRAAAPRARPRAAQQEDACKPGAQDERGGTISIDEVASTQDWHLRLRRDGDAIVRYLVENKCDLASFTIQDMIAIMRKLGIDRSDRQELFELLGHVKSSLSQSSVSVKTTHPLVLIYSHADTRIGEQLRALEKVYSPSRYHTLVATTRFQSANFTDMSSSQDLVFKYRDTDSTCFVHPILVALFGVKLPALENAFVYGDSYSLLRQLYDFKKVKPDNYMLLINRLTEDSPILFTGVHDVVSTEVQRANVHTMLRKIILNLRLGIFYCCDHEAVDSYLMKIIHTHSSQMMADEEQMLASVLAIASFRPALVSVMRPGGAGYDVNLQPVAYIAVTPSRMITTGDHPVAINSNSVYSLTFDSATGRVIFSPPHMSYPAPLGCRGVDALPVLHGNPMPVLDRQASAPVIVNGTLIYYVERRQSKNIIGGECYAGFRSVIDDRPMDIATDLTINGILYRLRSAVCYKISDQLIDGCEVADIFLKGYYTILFTELGPWLYDPLSVFSKPAREARLTRAMRNAFSREHAGEDDSLFYDWLKQESTQAVFLAKQQQLMNHHAMFDDDLIGMEEAMSLVSRHCCILVYAQDYEPYVSAKNIAEIFC